MTPVFPTLPAGKDRDKQTSDLRLKTDRRDTLPARQTQQGPEALLEAEAESNLVDAQVPLMQDLLAQGTAHRDNLPA